MKKLCAITVLLLLAALPAAAASVDETRSASPDADVSIELIAGDKIVIVGWDRDEVRVRGTINERWETLEIEGDGDDISIEIRPPKGSHRNVELEADLEISVPAGAEVSFETVSAPLEVRGLRDSLSVESVSGSIQVDSDLRELSIESISGGVEIVSNRAMESVEVETVSGGVEFRGDLAPDGDYSFSTVSGAITLHVPSIADAEYEIEVFSGSIDNDFGPLPTKAEFLPSKSLSFTVGSGSADVEISAVSGTVRLKAD